MEGWLLGLLRVLRRGFSTLGTGSGVQASGLRVYGSGFSGLGFMFRAKPKS